MKKIWRGGMGGGLLKPRWETASRNDGTFFQGIDATMGDCFARLGPPLLPWDNRMGRGQHR